MLFRSPGLGFVPDGCDAKYGKPMATPNTAAIMTTRPITCTPGFYSDEWSKLAGMLGASPWRVNHHRFRPSNRAICAAIRIVAVSCITPRAYLSGVIVFRSANQRSHERLYRCCRLRLADRYGGGRVPCRIGGGRRAVPHGAGAASTSLLITPVAAWPTANLAHRAL